MKASEIAQLVNGSFEGVADPELFDLAPLDRAQAEHLSFLADPRYLPYLRNAQAGAVLIAESLAMRGSTELPRIVVKDVHRALALLLELFHPDASPNPGVHPTAVIGAGVALSDDVSIGPYVVLGAGAAVGAGTTVGAHSVVGEDCDIGSHCTLHPHVTLYRRVRIGDRTIIHSGARIGSDGYGYVLVDGTHRKVPQVGTCILGSDVEVGANTTIDRGSIGATEIGDGVKIDNLVHIGHNVRIGAHTLIVAQVGISGSTSIGSGVTVAGQVGITGHVRIADNVVIGGGSAVWGDITEPGVYSGRPARPHKEELRMQASLGRVGELLKRLRAVERAIFGKNDQE